MIGRIGKRFGTLEMVFHEAEMTFAMTCPDKSFEPPSVSKGAEALPHPRNRGGIVAGSITARPARRSRKQ
jgi:hypothetical protein